MATATKKAPKAPINKGLKKQSKLKQKALLQTSYMNTLITQTWPHLFKAGATFTKANLCSMMRIPPMKKKNPTFKDYQQHNYKLIAAYTALNNVLAPCGLVIKSKNYYENYEVQAKDRVKDVIESYQHRSSILEGSASILARGQRMHKSKMKPLGPIIQSRVAERVVHKSSNLYI